MRIDWAPAVLRAAGLTVVETPGCYGRGVPLSTVLGIVNHGTGVDDPRWTIERQVQLLIDGRPDLEGPLAQFGLDWHGVWHFIADGKCNHNGYGEWGNQTIGVEMFGKDHFTPEQLVSAARGNAALLNHLVLPASRAKGHKETDPNRKPDPINLDMAAFRVDVAIEQDHLDRGTTPTDATEEEEILLWR